MKINIEELEYKFKFRENTKDVDIFPASMTLIIGQFKIKGFSVRRTKYEKNEKKFVLFPPANPMGHNKWVKLFWTDPKKEWELLEKSVLDQFDEDHADYLINNEVGKDNKEPKIDVERIKF